jgi:uncharacterized membrane protein
MERRGKSSRIVIQIFFFLFLTWSVLQFLAPLSLPRGSIDDLSGLTAVSDNEELFSDIPIPWNAVYSIGDRLCHQKAERSFFINDNQMPFCSRCTAIWLGLAIGLGVMVFYRIQLNEKLLFIVIAGLAPTGIDGIGQLFGFWESTNIIRVVTGLTVGIVCGVSIGIIIDEIKTIRPFKKTKK